MDIDLESLYTTIDQLDPQQRTQLISYLMSGKRPDAQGQSPSNEWQFNLAQGLIQTTSDFDDPLPDEFWPDRQ